jgi:hypothetical protein
MTAENTNQDGQKAGSVDMLRFFCDHLVVLGGSYVPLDAQGHDAGAEKFFAFSGFILSVRGVWCLVTAGHAVQELEEAHPPRQLLSRGLSRQQTPRRGTIAVRLRRLREDLHR